MGCVWMDLRRRAASAFGTTLSRFLLLGGCLLATSASIWS